MKSPVYQPQKAAAKQESRSHRPQPDAGQPGRLSQLVHALNQSDLVQRQLSLAGELNGSALVQAQMDQAENSSHAGTFASVIQLMGPSAKHYTNQALATKPGAHTYEALEGRLTPAEIAVLEQIWTERGAGKKPPRQIMAGEMIATRLLQIIATLRETVVEYESGFDTKHIHDGDVNSATAVQKGNARNPKPAWNTVFKKSYLETLVSASPDGNYAVVRRASLDGDGNIALAELRVATQDYKQAALGIYQYSLTYTVTTDWNTRKKTIKVSHMETA